MNIENLSEDELKEKFENFIFNVDDYIEDLESRTEKYGLKLDFSLDSLKEIEKYILKKNIKIDDDEYDYIAAYLGEVIVKNFKLKWQCNLDKINNSLYYGFPVLEGLSKKDVLYSPFHIIKAFILRHKEGLIINSIESLVNPEPIDWNKYSIEEEPKEKNKWNLLDDSDD